MTVSLSYLYRIYIVSIPYLYLHCNIIALRKTVGGVYRIKSGGTPLWQAGFGDLAMVHEIEPFGEHHLAPVA